MPNPFLDYDPTVPPATFTDPTRHRFVSRSYDTSGNLIENEVKVRLLRKDWERLVSLQEQLEAMRRLLQESYGWMNGVEPKPAESFLAEVRAAVESSPAKRPEQ